MQGERWIQACQQHRRYTLAESFDHDIDEIDSLTTSTQQAQLAVPR